MFPKRRQRVVDKIPKISIGSACIALLLEHRNGFLMIVNHHHDVGLVEVSARL